MRIIDRILIVAALLLFGHAVAERARDYWRPAPTRLRIEAPARPVDDIGNPAPRQIPRNLIALPPASNQDPLFDVAPTQARRPNQRSVGTAFAVGRDGATWLTARHVIDHCATVQVLTAGRVTPVDVTFTHQTADIAVLHAPDQGPPLPVTEGPLGYGEDGYAFGIAGEGGPSGIQATLLGRARLQQSGRMTGMTEVTVWAERAWIPPGERWIGGMSGGPLLTGEGNVAGIMSVASERRGRIFTVSPETIVTVMRARRIRFVPGGAAPVATAPDALAKSRDALLNRRSVVQLLCTA
ncbi:MAG: trypsin-like peptidase domain-containing protein [Alphaproteobacteria bacterium]|nr:trypsin-like peptidase domain-containing protein [Alphaproteobacteria bacterium]